MGCVVPPGIATDDSNKAYIQKAVNDSSLVCFYDFTNRGYTFPNVESTMSFSLLVLSDQPTAEFSLSAQLWNVTDLNIPDRVYTLTRQDLQGINPNTLNLPIVRSKRDADIILSVYAAAPVMVRESDEYNPWRVDFRQGLFNMTTDGACFRTKAELLEDGCELRGNRFFRDGETYLPLYESKLANQYTHRAATFDSTDPSRMFGARAATRKPTKIDLADPNFTPIPRYWVQDELVPENKLTSWEHEWFIGFRRTISAVADARSALFFALPEYGVGDSVFLLYSELEPRMQCCLLWLTNSFVFDYVARQKASGGNLSFYVVKQLPVVSPDTITPEILEFVVPRVLELCYTSFDLEPFAHDCGYDHPPFRWDAERQTTIRHQLDALAFSVYGIDAQDAAFIMDSFPVVKRKDIARTEQKDADGNITREGTYLTKDRILEIYDQMLQARREGREWQSPLDPPPGPPTDPEGNFLPMAEWPHHPSHIHPPKGEALPQDALHHFTDLANGDVPTTTFPVALPDDLAAKVGGQAWTIEPLTASDPMPNGDDWVVVAHPDLQRRDEPCGGIAAGKISRKERTDATTGETYVEISLKGPIPPASLRLTPDEAKDFRPLGILHTTS